jgi:hypothetical protein
LLKNFWWWTHWQPRKLYVLILCSNGSPLRRLSFLNVVPVAAIVFFWPCSPCLYPSVNSL